MKRLIKIISQNDNNLKFTDEEYDKVINCDTCNELFREIDNEINEFLEDANPEELGNFEVAYDLDDDAYIYFEFDQDIDEYVKEESRINFDYFYKNYIDQFVEETSYPKEKFLYKPNIEEIYEVYLDNDEIYTEEDLAEYYEEQERKKED